MGEEGGKEKEAKEEGGHGGKEGKRGGGGRSGRMREKKKRWRRRKKSEHRGEIGSIERQWRRRRWHQFHMPHEERNPLRKTELDETARNGTIVKKREKNLVPPRAALPQFPRAICRPWVKNRPRDPSPAGNSFSTRGEKERGDVTLATSPLFFF
ncbi:hypothetical protein B296_00055316 [Ensete ventricosum]|uniref:Uncharacterized protein n=1 Tax=Ensete ventricosum TaxID=4639 RepID=A0A426Y044_ENSVE|nr:hypothetical protein B296_00055316 [Ensete ventricosum]